MAIDIDTIGSPGWYLKRLSKKLQDRYKTVDAAFERFENRSPVPQVMQDAPDAARRFFQASRTAFAEMVVKAIKYPLRVQGILTDADASTGDLGDVEAERMFKRSGMAVEVDDVHRITLVSGNGYAIVDLNDDKPTYTSEDPRQVVTLHDPIVQSKVIAAGKFFFHDEDSLTYAYLWLPGRVWRAVYPAGRARPKRTPRFSSAWDWDEAFGGEEGWSYPDDLSDYMPVLRYRNEEGVGEFIRHEGLLDRLDHMVLQGMTIATLQAFKQRAIKVPEDDMPAEDEDGREIDYNDTLSADPGALWKLPETAEIWESGNVDLTPVWTGMEKFTQQLSAVTFTPLAMFSPEGQNQSAAGSAFAREGRTFKIEDRQDRFGATHAEALAKLFRLSGDTQRSEAESIEVVWRPAERYSLAEKADALPKFKAGEVPWRSRMIQVGQYTPRQVQRMESERLTDAVLFPADTTATAAQQLVATPESG